MNTKWHFPPRRGALWVLAGILCTAEVGAVPPEPLRDGAAADTTLVVRIGNRLFPDFHETTRTGMRQRLQIGDTDYFFEVVGFYPHFAIIDSTKEVVTLSDEPENVAFKITVYENDEIVDNTWAFYDIQIPHFARTSYLTFDVLEFTYRGEVFELEPEEAEAENATQDAHRVD